MLIKVNGWYTVHMEIDFCRRCGTKLISQGGHIFVCQNGHSIYANAAPAVAAVLLNSKDEVLTVRRLIAPGVGELDFPGGFCDGAETAEEAAARELVEEINLSPEHYSSLKFICTGIDDYVFGGETVTVLSIVFTATVKDDAPIVTGDDAGEAEFTPLEAIDPDKIYFPSLQKALTLLQNGGN